MHRIIGTLQLALLILLLTTLLSACGERAKQLQSGEAAPSLEVETLDGKRLNFPADFSGKVVALRFWADWCPFCKDEMNAIEPIFQQYQEQGLEILAINAGQSRRVAQRFIDKLQISYTVGLDEESEAARSYGVLGLPTTFFIDREGKVQRKILGESEADTFARVIKELL